MNSRMRRLVPVIVVLLAAVLLERTLFPEGSGDAVHSPDAASFDNATPTRNTAQSIIADAFAARRSGIQVEDAGTVTRVLADDLRGDRHQRFILELSSGQTVLVAHNIDLAPRIANLRDGDRVRFFGEYEWNDQGGVIHWTHHDPAGRHPDGWLEHGGRRYQ